MQLPDIKEPLVSVVMVTHGSGEVALDAVKALADHTNSLYELILVDNASPDRTVELLESTIWGGTIVANPSNDGFSHGSNQGAALARGTYLCFLNPDVFVQPGWLEPLLEAFERDGGVGAAAPLFLYPDGRVQEAGSAVDSDGVAIAIGDGGDPSAFELRFRRTIDYGSAACLLVRADLFEEVDGFDPAYSPAYYEDADLCFKLAERGFSTVLEPESRVIHLRGGESPHATRLIAMNRRIFAEKWVGPAAPPPSAPRRPTERPHTRCGPRRPGARTNPRRRRPRPAPRPGVGRPANGEATCRDCRSLARRSSHTPRGHSHERTAVRAAVAGAGNRGRLCGRALRSLVRPEAVSLLSRPRSRASNIERFEQHLRRTQPQARRIYDIEALAFRRFEQRDEDMANRLRDLEQTGIDGADVVICVSEEEASFARERTSVPVHVLPTYADVLDEPPGFDSRQGVIFFGGFLAGPGGPNEDAAVRLVEEVMPTLWEALPELELEIVGADPTPAVRELHRPLVEVVGFDPDPMERLSRARVHVHPLQFGAGIKLKLIDTMAAGLPFVTTPVGAEGLGLGELEDLLVAESPGEVARLALDLYHDPVLWSHVRREILELVENRFGRDRFRQTLIEAFAQVGVAPPRGRAVTFTS